jgi:hypothetical protein
MSPKGWTTSHTTISTWPKGVANGFLNFSLLMDGMAPAAWTKFLDRKFFRLAFLIFAGHVIAPLTAIALKPDKVSHFRNPGAPLD